MGHIQGEVTSSNETTKEGKDRYGVKLGDEWFNGFGKCPVKKGGFCSSASLVSEMGKTGW